MKSAKQKIWRGVVIVGGIFIIFASLFAFWENLLAGDFVMVVASLLWTMLVGVLIYNFATGKTAFGNILNKEVGIRKKHPGPEKQLPKNSGEIKSNNFCSNCGTPISSGAKFCASCGVAVLI